MTESPPPPTEFQESRNSGVLLPIFSLPSRFGIGDLGAYAYRFADSLLDAGQTYWQVLPLNPPNPRAFGSPYDCYSNFAGNPLLIDLATLAEEGLLTKDELENAPDPSAVRIDYGQVTRFKMDLLAVASARFARRDEQAEFEEFYRQQQYWLDDYALFMVLTAEYPELSWTKWPTGLRDREPAALADARRSLAAAIEHWQILQYFFFRQWRRLKSYCNEKGLSIFGDMPIYSNLESADVWANSEIYQLDQDRRPTAVSGVPPDYFSPEGQLWGNPLYDWHELERQGFRWWVERIGALFEIFDIVRIDHFRGLVQYWEVPVPCDSAMHGSWRQAPTQALFAALKSAFPRFPVVAEDLGTITHDVAQARDQYQLPGMLVMQFAFVDDRADNPHLPQNHRENSVIYFGTHDNNTARGWLEEECGDAVRERLSRHVEFTEDKAEMVPRLLELVMSSRARTAIVCAQDLLALPSRARINVPGTTADNWSWRMSVTEFETIDWELLAALSRRSGRHIAARNIAEPNPSN
ncbi:MAG: 4-alpha-glucanotransferase [Gammaproteobacteria bacterium]|nr:4-alpha-glucanotransferase [Gammaproteobacteria bacterium]MYG96887.1 4-alpha-glucanotransferase [Gammaproteobacteria bacterium]